MDAAKPKGRPLPVPGPGPVREKQGLTPLLRIPSGVADFDAITGGLPPGSVILLMGDSGAGHTEFALTSASKLTRAVEGTEEFYMGPFHGATVLPTHVTYVSFTRSREQLLHEIRNSFPVYFPTFLSKHMAFVDLSSAYFADSIVPPEWSRSRRSLLDGSSGPSPGLLPVLATELENRGKNSLVVVDTLSDLLVRRSIEKEDVVTLVKGLRSRAKDWRGLIYLLSARHVTEPHIEEALKDSVDAVLDFSWVQSPHKSSRIRAMWIEKSMPLLSHVPPARQGRFVINVSDDGGLVTTQYERID